MVPCLGYQCLLPPAQNHALKPLRKGTSFDFWVRMSLSTFFCSPPLRGQALRSPAVGRSPGLGGGASLKAGQRNSYLEVERRSFPKGHSRGMARAEEERRGRRGEENIGRGRRFSSRLSRVFRACSRICDFCVRCSAFLLHFVLRSSALRLAVR